MYNNVNIKLFFISTFLILSFIGCKNDDNIILRDSDEMLFWQGMYHEWQYNHRVNRMGDWITINRKKPDASSYNHIHSAASGSGSDRCTFKNFSSRIVSPSMRFSQGKFTTRMKGVENTTTTNNLKVEVELPNELLLYDNYEVIINGFDMYPTQITEDPNLLGDGTADKIFEFGCIVNNETRGADNDFSFDLNLKFGADCESPECSKGPHVNFFDYQVSIFYVIIAYDDELAITNISFNNAYAWEKPTTPQANSDVNEIFRSDFTLKNVTIQGNIDQNFTQALTLFKGFDFFIEEGPGGFTGDLIEHPHLLALDMAIRNENYDNASNEMELDLDLFFKNWTAPIPFVSFGNGGAIDFNAHLTLIQFRDDISIEPNVSIGYIDWKTNPLFNEPPTVGKALNIQEINF